MWVIAQAEDAAADPGIAANPLIKIVVTDDKGRFVIPDLPSGRYKVWSRGYGLMDSRGIDASPGKTVRITADIASTPQQAAQIYPANSWFSLIHVPAEGEFPGTGPNGNGISPAFKTQADWIAHMIENCEICHQIGTKTTRELPGGENDPVAAWNQRIQKNRNPDDPLWESGTRVDRGFADRMNTLMTLYGRQRGLEMFADWTTRIANGEVPSAPARPTGVERNLVLTIRNIAGGRFLHDSASSDKRHPTINAGGPIYGTATFTGVVVAFDPNTGQEHQFKMTDRQGNRWETANNHTPALDSQGRVWMTNIGTLTAAMRGRPYQGDNPDFCTDPNNKFAGYFPRDANEAQLITMFDPKTGKNEVIPVCFGTHHLGFDANERLYFSGDTQVVGWLDTKTWDTTHDAAKAVGWCPMVLDTNGDGTISMDKTQWNQQLEGVAGGEGANITFKDAVAGSSHGLDPKRDTRIAGFTYGMGINPKDQSYWAAKFSPYIPSGIVRVDPGANPPFTCKTEYYEPPKVNGVNRAYNARGVDVDADGVAWVAFGTGALGRFDRSKCRVLNGPAATGAHCPEGWEIIDTPGPTFAGTHVRADWSYLTVVDHDDALGLGREVPMIPNSSGDELLAYLPKEKKFVHLRVPYPLGFYPRTLDGRIDNEKGGWKGRGLWATNNVIPHWHQETGEGSTAIVVHFQMRPNSLDQ